MPACRVFPFLMLFVAVAPAAEPAALHWKLDPKTPFYVRVKSHKKDDRRKDEQHVVTEYDLELLYRIRLLEKKADGSNVIEFYIQSVRHRPVGGSETVQLRVMEGKAVRVTLDADMNVSGMEGLDAIVPAGGFPGQQAAAEKATRSMFEGWLEPLFFPLPATPIHQGQSWTRQHEHEQPWLGRWKRKTTFTDRETIREAGREVHRLTVNTDVSLSGPVPVPPGSPYEEPTGELKGSTSTGVILFDPAVGRPVRIERTSFLHTVCTMKYLGQTHTDENRQDETFNIQILDIDPLLAEAPRALPRVDPKEALAREDKRLPRQLTNSLGMKLALIPHGKFLMGSPRTEEHRNFDEDQHEVEITRPFYMGAHEVTVGQFRKFVEETGYKTLAESGFMGGRGYNAEKKDMEWGKAYTWKDPGYPQTDEHPVGTIAWVDAQAFCEWLSRKEGKVYCLPTEAEWEYACRAGTTTARVSGDDAESLVKMGNVGDASVKKKFPTWETIKGDDGFAFSAPVGRFEANAWGLYDMHGNVAEWCADWAGAYDTRAKKDPRGPGSGTQRIARGGSYADFPHDQRCARRTAFAPTMCHCGIGFRVVQIVPPEKP